MRNDSNISSANRRILFIGNSSGVFMPRTNIEENGFECCENMLDAISLAVNTEFEMFAVVVGDFDANLSSALKTLRQLRPGAKIILLVRKMYEEPEALRLVLPRLGAENLADDYYICPVSPKLFFPARPGGNGKRRMAAEAAQSTEQLNRIAILEKLATEDELTGIKNRRYIREFLRQIIDRARKEDLQVTLLIFDIDDFKKYNDLYGHFTGDTILKQVAVLMQKCCRKQDVVSRIGGDEFAVVFWNCKNETDNTVQPERRASQGHPDEITIICERFRSQINSTPLPALGVTGKGRLSISGGLAAFPRDGSDVAQLFVQADNALLEAKRGGKNRVFLVGKDIPKDIK